MTGKKDQNIATAGTVAARVGPSPYFRVTDRAGVRSAAFRPSPTMSGQQPSGWHGLACPLPAPPSCASTKESGGAAGAGRRPEAATRVAALRSKG